MDAINITGKMSDVDFIVHILVNLPEEYDASVKNLGKNLKILKIPWISRPSGLSSMQDLRESRKRPKKVMTRQIRPLLPS